MLPIQDFFLRVKGVSDSSWKQMKENCVFKQKFLKQGVKLSKKLRTDLDPFETHKRSVSKSPIQKQEFVRKELNFDDVDQLGVVEKPTR